MSPIDLTRRLAISTHGAPEERGLEGPAAGPDPVRAGEIQRRASETQRPLIELRAVSKTYALGQIEVRALQQASLQIERGEFVAIIGSSGSGKSTMMHIVGCLDVPTSGRYLIDGIDAGLLDEDELSDLRNRKIGFVFQSFNLVARTSALANVELPLAYAGLGRAERRRRAERVLTSVGMSNRMRHVPSELSGGQQQRVAVARAIVTNPSLVLADEPTGNLDSHSSDEVLGIFEDLHRQGRTVVIVTHEPHVAERASRIVRLSDGRIVEDWRVDGAGAGERLDEALDGTAPGLREVHR